MRLQKVLTRLCKEQGITLSRLSKDSGVPLQTIHGWTVGRKSINPAQVKKVAEALNISLHYLLFEENDSVEPKPDEILKEIFKGDVRITVHRIERK